MLSEEGLILVVVLGACGLVLLGALELVWPTRPRHPERRPTKAPDPMRRARVRQVGPPPVAAPERPAAVEAPPIEPQAVQSPVVAAPDVVVPPEPVTLEMPQYLPVEPSPPVVAEPRAFADGPALRVVASGAASPDTVRSDRPRSPRVRPILRPVRPLLQPAGASPVQAVSPEPVALPSPPQPSPPDAAPEVSVAGRGLALVTAGQFSEAVALAQEALAAAKSTTTAVPTTSAARETARLWGVVGLAKSGLDDVEGARFAFEEAIALAPGTDRLTWERHLVDLALTVGRRALGDLDQEVRPEPDRIATLRSAIEWLERGLDVAPEDLELRGVLGAAREALWPTHETIVKHLVQRREFAEARRVLIDVMADPECPPERQGAFRRLLGRAKGGEAAQETADASAYLQGGRPDETMAALLRAQNLIETIAPDALAPARRQELDRRLWAGYLALGANRVDAGMPEAALDPLIRAASLGAVAAERREEARGLLVRTYEQIVERRSVEISRLIDAADTKVAAVHAEKLWSLLRGAVDQGLTQEDLAESFARVGTLLDRSGARRS